MLVKIEYPDYLEADTMDDITNNYSKLVHNVVYLKSPHGYYLVCKKKNGHGVIVELPWPEFDEGPH